MNKVKNTFGRDEPTIYWRGESVAEMSEADLRKAFNELALLYQQALHRNLEKKRNPWLYPYPRQEAWKA